MLLETVFICLILLALSCRRHHFDFLPFEWLMLLFISFVVKIVAAQLIRGAQFHLIDSLTVYIQVVIYASLFGFILINIKHYKTLIVVGAGFLLNAIVIFINNARMPVATTLALNNGFMASLKQLNDGFIFGHQPLTAATKLPFLADIISVMSPYPRPQTLSIGDIIIDIGLVLLTLEMIMLARKANKNVD